MVYKEDKKGKYFLPSKKNKNDHSNNFKCYLKKKKKEGSCLLLSWGSSRDFSLLPTNAKAGSIYLRFPHFPKWKGQIQNFYKS